jgi:endoglucanase
MYERLSVKKINTVLLGLILLLATITSCNGDEATPNTDLTVSVEVLSFNQLGAVQSFQIKTNKPWELISSQPWVTFTPATGGAGTINVAVRAEIHTSAETRTTTILVKAGSPATEEVIAVSQLGNEIAIPDDQAGMTDNAMTLASKMGLGWNLGNSLEATSGPNASGVYTASEIRRQHKHY